MKPKKIVKLVICFSLILTISSCRKKHEHSFSDNYNYNEVYHWNEASCEHQEEIANKEKHNFSEWKINSDRNIKERKCINCGFEQNEFDNYGTTPYDHNLGITVREVENRQSKYATSTDETTLGENEKSTYNFQITLVKLQTKVLIENIKIYVSAETVSGSYVHKEFNGKKNMSEYTYISMTSFSKFAKKEVLKKNGTAEQFLQDETPKTIFVKITYTINDEDYELTYKTSVLDEKKYNFDEFENRFILSENNLHEYVDPKEDPVRIKISKESAQSQTSVGNINEDKIKIQFNVFSSNLNLFKYSEEYLNKNSLKTIELPMNLNAEKPWDIDPEISEIKFEVYAKIKSTDDNFSEYVKIYSIYGFMSKYRELLITTIDIDESFDVEEIYVISEGKLYNATKDNFSISFKYTLPN